MSPAPTHLRCELLVDPLALDTRAPRLSWRPPRGQTAWQVRAEAEDGRTLWDSGEVEGDEPLHVPYAGTLPPPGTVCRWRVRTWDGDGTPSEWSEPALFGVGPPDEGWATERELGPAPAPDEIFDAASDPVPRWIGAPSDRPWSETEPPPSPLLRREFALPAPPRRALAYATALGVYELRLNGLRVGDAQLAPEWTSYGKRLQYQAYDVTALLREGENAVGAILAPGWYAGRIGLAQLAAGGIRRGIYGRHLRLRLRIDVELRNGARSAVLSDERWRLSLEGPVRGADLLDGERVDLRREPPGWDEAGFDDSGWVEVAVSEGGPRLHAQPNEPIRVTEEVAAVAVHEPRAGVHVFDLGQQIAGWARLRVRGRAGGEVVLRHGEALEDDGRLYRDNLRLPPVSPHGAAQEDRFVLAGGGDETLEPRFTYHGFRYVEVEGLEEPPQAGDLVGRVLHSDVAPAGRFECSSELLNRIVSAVEWTLRCNLHSIPTDCPQRDERMGWSGDIQVFAQAACFHRDMAAFFRKWLRDLRDDQADDGRFPDFAPHPYDPNARFSGNPGWADAGLVVPWTAYVNYADHDLLAEHYHAARRWVDFVARHNPDAVWRRELGRPISYGDWLNGDTLRLEGWPRTGANVPIDVYATAFFARSAELLARMAGVLGRWDDAQGYGDLGKRVRAAFAAAFVDEEGTIAGDTQAGYALALAFDLLPDGARQRAAWRMARALERYGGHLATGFNTTARMMIELSRRGYHEQACAVALATGIPSWGYMVEHGATTIWERWDGFVEGRGFQDPRMNSLCHYAIGAVSEWVFRVLGGLEPDERHPGWKRFTVAPLPGGGIEWARTEYESIRGPIRSEWEASDGRVRLRVAVPPGTRATVHVPGGEVREVGPGDHELRSA